MPTFAEIIKSKNMNWFGTFLTSKMGQKIVMSLTGLFLTSFLLIHLAGNLQLLKDDQGEAFNRYAHFMVHNPVIEFVSIGLYISILIHAIQGIWIAIANRKARGAKSYAKTSGVSRSWASGNMANDRDRWSRTEESLLLCFSNIQRALVSMLLCLIDPGLIFSPHAWYQ